MSDESNNKKYKVGSGELNNPYDPLSAAKRQGNVFGKGISGKYQKNKITLTGFFLLSLFLFIFGTLFIYIAFNPEFDSPNAEKVIHFWTLYVLGAVFTTVGVCTLKSLFKRGVN